MAPTSQRRVSYVITPSPTDTVPKLRLPPDGAPRNGQTGPIILPATSSDTETHGSYKKSRFPRHRLGVAAFALDSATVLAGRDSPEGILYSGGRDGMVISWDLGMPMKLREPRFRAPALDGSRRMGRWERLTIDEDEDNAIYEEDDDEWPTSDGDVIGDVLESGGRRGSRYWAKEGDIPYEQRWELDVNRVEPEQPAYYRQHAQSHTDWVNDLLLCNLNQTVVSGSSDGTVKAWNPHSPVLSSPSIIGTHTDYVRCLSQCYERKWIASGSFDRTIKLWDIAQHRTDPLMTLCSPESTGPKASVYALAADPFGHVIAAGGPERVVRTWDPRSGKRIGKLVGHTDNIRAVLISEDSRYLLTGSADASIKLWSILSPQRCIYTFTHHTESVWSLFSSHPALEVFYSGDRSGLVCRVDVEECERVAQGECTVLCKDDGEPSLASSEGVSKILAMDDNLVWTASGSSSIRRWRVPQSRIARALSSSPLDGSNNPIHYSAFGNLAQPLSSPDRIVERRARGQSITPSITASLISEVSSEVGTGDYALNGIPYESLVKLSAPNAHHGPFSISRGRESDVVTLYSAASVKSIPRQLRSPTSGTLPSHSYSHSQGQISVGAYGHDSGRRDTLSPPVIDGVAFTLPNARMAYEDRDVAPDARPLVSEPDLLIEGEHGLVRVLIMNDRIHALTVDTAGIVAVWDIIRCQCLGTFAREDVYSANTSAASSIASGGNGQGSTADRISPRQALEIVRDRIEGEAVVNPWANADTRIGELTIHILDRCFESEIFADEAGYGPERSYSDDHRLNIGKWILRNLFMGFIREEQRIAAKLAHEKSLPPTSRSPYTHRSHSATHLRSHSDSSSGDRTPVALTAPHGVPPVPALPSNVVPTMTLGLHGLSPIAQSPAVSVGSEALPTPRPANYARSNLSFTVEDESSSGMALQTPVPSSAKGPTAVPASPSGSMTPSAAPVSINHDYFSIRRRPSTSYSTSTTQTVPAVPLEDDFSGWGGPGSAKNSTAHEIGPATPSTPGGGFMGRLKNLGKSTRKVASDAETPSVFGTLSLDSGVNKIEDHIASSSPPKTLIERLKSQPISPPSSTEAPLLSLPNETAIVISEESSSGWAPVYRGSVGSAGTDIQILEEVLPEWLLEFLLANKSSSPSTTKISFVLLPAPIAPESKEIYGETLPELLNSAQSKLSASRFLRVKKLTYHVQEKLDKNPQSKPTSPRTSTDTAPAGRGSVSLGTPPSPEAGAGTASTSSPAGSRATTPLLSPNFHTHGHGQGLPRAEDVYEILCNDQVLSLDITLAAARQFVWRQSGELVMHYRRKPRSLSAPI